MSGDISSERAAGNESLYRSVNEQLRSINVAAEQLGDRVSEWICECADTACALHVHATLSEYERVRSNPRAFIVYHGHIYREVEVVLAENDRYTTVEKHANGGSVAEALDPRGNGHGRLTEGPSQPPTGWRETLRRQRSSVRSK